MAFFNALAAAANQTAILHEVPQADLSTKRKAIEMGDHSVEDLQELAQEALKRLKKMDIDDVSELITDRLQRMQIHNEQPRRIKISAADEEPEQSLVLVTECTPLDQKRQTAFSTKGVLENILKHVDLPDLLHAREVCKLWFHKIRKSAPLQDQLRFKTFDFVQPWLLDNSTGHLIVFSHGEEYRRSVVWYRRQGLCYPVKLNTMLLKRDPRSESGERNLRKRYNRAEAMRFVRPVTLCGCGIESCHTNAMMHITAPPTDSVVALINYKVKHINGSTTEHYARSKIRIAGGITWKALISKLYDVMPEVDQKRADEHRLYVNIEKSKIWCVGVVFPNDAETAAVTSGREDRDFDMSVFK